MNQTSSTKYQNFISLVVSKGSEKLHISFVCLKIGTFQIKFDTIFYFVMNMFNLFMKKRKNLEVVVFELIGNLPNNGKKTCYCLMTLVKKFQYLSCL